MHRDSGGGVFGDFSCSVKNGFEGAEEQNAVSLSSWQNEKLNFFVRCSSCVENENDDVFI
jgi:hypothetical protein